MGAQRKSEDDSVRSSRSVTVWLESYAWHAIAQEAAREGLSMDEIVTFAVLYFLADVDSGRISRRISTSPYPRGLERKATADPPTEPQITDRR